MSDVNKTLLACDLDNTLIYSKKRFHEGYTCVEWIHGEEQAYMSPNTVELLREANRRFTFLPVTSRSIEQYGRICFPEGCRPRYAICTNGSNLLTDGKIDLDWAKETQELIRPWKGELGRMEALLSPMDIFIRCRMVDEGYLFVYCNKDVSPSGTARRIQAETGLNVIASGKKIYLLPPPVNKGDALKRFIAKTAPGRVIASGDGEMDVPMLNVAHMAVCPSGLMPGAENAVEYAHTTEIPFSEFALKTALEFTEE